MKPLVLASGSPYRKVLLEKLRLDFITCSPHVDEVGTTTQSSKEKAVSLAVNKARAVANRYGNHLIIGCDQIAMLGSKQLCKPGNRAATIEQLIEQSGQSVAFHTGLCVLDSADGRYRTALDTCTVFFKQMNQRQIEHYIDLEQPYDCAGGFKAEGLGIALFRRIEGDDPNSLIGLPLIKLIGLLEQFNHPIL